MRRYSLILGGPQPLAHQSSRLNGRTLKAFLDKIAHQLADLGEGFSFEPIGDRTHYNNVKAVDLLGAIDSAPSPSDEDVVLLWYIGHSSPIGTDDLQLSFSDGGPEKLGNVNYALSAIISRIKSHGFRRVICILDCCQGIGALKNIDAQMESYLVMFSATNSYAASDAEAGLFSKALLDTLNFDPRRTFDQRINIGKSAVTFESSFSFAKSLLEQSTQDVSFMQDPAIFGSGMDQEVFKSVEISIEDGLNIRARVNSTYRKLYEILVELEGGKLSLDQLRSSIVEKKNPSFRTTRIDAVNWDYLNRRRLKELVFTLAALRLLEFDGNKIHLTPDGKVAAREGSFNKSLLRSIENHILPEGITIEVLRSITTSLLHRPLAPDSMTVAVELYQTRNVVIGDLKVFKECFGLLPFTGVFHKAPSDTLFPGLRVSGVNS